VVQIETLLTSGNKKSLLDGVPAGGHGLELLESGAGDLTAEVSKSNSAGNESYGIFGDETGAGTGTVSLSGVTYFGKPNGLGEKGGTATFVIVP
jgi:hypothetical protein